MTTIWERVETALGGLTVPVVANNWMAATGTSSLPETFVVYQMISSTGEQHADDDEINRSRRVQVSLYSRVGLVGLPDVDTLMLAAGFTRGPERELPINPQTRHYGLAKDYFYLDEE